MWFPKPGRNEETGQLLSMKSHAAASLRTNKISQKSKLQQFLDLKNVVMIKDYCDDKVEDIRLASRQKLTRKNYQFLKIVQIKEILDS